MNENGRDHATKVEGEHGKPKARKPYKRPAFQFEKVFETMALACGKLSATQLQCRFNRRNS